jgi:hypothetical protein
MGVNMNKDKQQNNHNDNNKPDTDLDESMYVAVGVLNVKPINTATTMKSSDINTTEVISLARHADAAAELATSS